MKGNILDVYPEGEEIFRACVLEVMGNNILYVLNLSNGKKSMRSACECEYPLINDIFHLDY
jgi:hypothetical protein